MTERMAEQTTIDVDQKQWYRVPYTARSTGFWGVNAVYSNHRSHGNLPAYFELLTLITSSFLRKQPVCPRFVPRRRERAGMFLTVKTSR